MTLFHGVRRAGSPTNRTPALIVLFWLAWLALGAFGAAGQQNQTKQPATIAGASS